MRTPVDPYPVEYGAAYFELVGGLPYRRDDHWLGFFGRIADRIVEDIAPRTVLDAGCAMGFLVEALRDRGADAFGLDVSEYALGQVRQDLRPCVWQASIGDPLDRDYDLIVCIEVLEHLRATEIDSAIDNLCAHGREILFSSTPNDFTEPTHFHVKPTSYWVAAFARRGFLPDVEYDASYITPWARRFRQTDEPVWRTLEAYERNLARLDAEVQSLRQELVLRRDANTEAPNAKGLSQRALHKLRRRN